MDRADLSSADLSATEVVGASLVRADLSDTDAPYASFNGANLTSADLRQANLAEADLTDAVLAHANLDRADLSSSYLIRTDLRGVDLTNVGLAGAVAVDTKLDPHATLPPDIWTGRRRTTRSPTRARLTGPAGSIRPRTSIAVPRSRTQRLPALRLPAGRRPPVMSWPGW